MMAFLTILTKMKKVGKRQGRQRLTAVWNRPSDAQDQQIFVVVFYEQFKQFLDIFFNQIHWSYLLKVCRVYLNHFWQRTQCQSGISCPNTGSQYSPEQPCTYTVEAVCPQAKHACAFFQSTSLP